MEDNNEIDKFGHEIELRNVHSLFFDDYRKLAPMMYYPPLCLSKNLNRFTDDLVKAHNAILTKNDYDKTLFGRIENRWASELKEARRISEDGSIPAEDVMNKFLNDNPNIDFTELPFWAARL